jgi:hypothetical protein
MLVVSSESHRTARLIVFMLVRCRFLEWLRNIWFSTTDWLLLSRWGKSAGLGPTVRENPRRCEEKTSLSDLFG